MPKGDKYSFKHEELIPFLQSIARHLTDDSHHDLISAKIANGIAFKKGITPEEVVNSYPWYVRQAKLFLEQDIKLPPVTQMKCLRMGPGMRFAEHGLHRKTPSGGEGDILPIVFEPAAVPLIQSTPEFLDLKQDAPRLSALMNKTYYAPSEARVRYLIEKFDAFCLAHRSNRPMVVVPDVTNQAMPQIVPPEGWSNTRTVELFRASLNQNAGIMELIRAAVSFIFKL